MSRRIAFLIANQKFRPDSGLSPLRGPLNDVAALSNLLGDPQHGNFDVRTFVNSSSGEIKAAIDEELGVAGRGDLVLIHYAGHGKLDRFGALCLATSDTRASALQATSIPTRHIRDFVSNSDCDAVVLLLDCCYSGAATNDTRGDLESQLVSLEDASGFYILSASSDIQTASESEVDGVVLGRFAAAILQGIQTGEADYDEDNRILLNDVFRYVRANVRHQSPKLFSARAGGDPLISLSPATELRKEVARQRRYAAEALERERQEQEADRLAAEALERERQKQEADRLAAEAPERERQKQEADRLAAEALERERQKQEADRLAAEALERERQKQEADRLAAEALERERQKQEADRLAAEALERERQKQEADRLAAEALERERQKQEADRLAAEALERERQKQEADRLAAEALERERQKQEADRLAAEALERERQKQEADRLAAEALERERQKQEADRLAAEALERERQKQEADRLAAEALERERQKQEADRLAAEALERERQKQEADRLAAEAPERERQKQEADRHRQQRLKILAASTIAALSLVIVVLYQWRPDPAPIPPPTENTNMQARLRAQAEAEQRTAELARQEADRLAQIAIQQEANRRALEEARQSAIQKAQALLRLSTATGLRRWSTGMCNDPTKTYSAEVHDGNLTWRRDDGNTDIESIESSSDSSFQTTTVSSVYNSGKPEEKGTRWSYSTDGARLKVRRNDTPAFSLARCQ